MNIVITGSVLRDKANADSRNYVNVIISAKDKGSTAYLHVRNYQVNRRSRLHKMLVTGYESYSGAEKAWSALQKKKLDADRIEHTKVMDEFSSLDGLVEELQNVVYCITMVNARKLKNTIDKRMSEVIEEDSLSFDEKMERRIIDSEDFAEMEKEAGIGEGTAELAGSSWGLF